MPWTAHSIGPVTHPDSARPPHAALQIVLRTLDERGAARALEALRAERLIGLVDPSAGDAALGLVSGLVALDHDGLALVATADGPASGLSLDVIAARLSRTLDAAVRFLEVDDDGEWIDELAGAAPPGLDPQVEIEARAEALATPGARSVVLLQQRPAEVRLRLPELAMEAGAAVTLIPADERSVLVIDGPGLPSWPIAWRPAVVLSSWPGELGALVWLRAPEGRKRSMQERIHQPVPDWGLTWVAPPVGIVAAAAAQAEAERQAPAVQRVLAIQGALVRRGAMEVPDAVLKELGLGERHRGALQRLWSEDLPAVDAARVVEALGLPHEVAALASGRRDAATWPGAEMREPAGLGRTIAAATALGARPTGLSLWARMERWWYDHPRFSIAAGIGMLLFAAAVATAVLLVPEQVGASDSGLLHWLTVGLVGLNGLGTLITGVLGLRSPVGD
jgi:hypothetical protein